MPPTTTIIAVKLMVFSRVEILSSFLLYFKGTNLLSYFSLSLAFIKILLFIFPKCIKFKMGAYNSDKGNNVSS